MPRHKPAWDVVLPNNDHLLVTWEHDYFTTHVWGDEPEGIVSLAAELWPGTTLKVKRDLVMLPLRVLRAVLAEIDAAEGTTTTTAEEE